MEENDIFWDIAIGDVTCMIPMAPNSEVLAVLGSQSAADPGNLTTAIDALDTDCFGIAYNSFKSATNFR